jgi:hypothetical protein
MSRRRTMLTPGVQTATGDGRLQRWAEAPVPSRTSYLRDRELLVPLEHGLLGRPGSDFLVHFGDDGRTVRIACSEGPRQLGPCQMFFPAVGADWSTFFRQGLLPRWRELAEGLRCLIEGFAITDPGKGDNL